MCVCMCVFLYVCVIFSIEKSVQKVLIIVKKYRLLLCDNSLKNNRVVQCMCVCVCVKEKLQGVTTNKKCLTNSN